MVLAFAVGGVMLLAASVVDLKQRRIPNSITYAAIALCLGAAAIGAVTGNGSHVVAAAIGSGLFGFLLYVPHRADPQSMGLGDVKLALSLGFAIGWVQAEVTSAVLAVAWTLAASALIGLLMAACAAVSRGERPRSGQAVAFGPALSIAGSVAVGAALF